MKELTTKRLILIAAALEALVLIPFVIYAILK